MPQTPNSSNTSYVSAANFFLCYSPSIVADMLRSNPAAPQPSYLAMLDTTNPAGAKLNYHLRAGGGRIEASCGVAKRYTPSDLQALTGDSAVFLQKLNAACGMWSLVQFLKPLTARPKDVPFVEEAVEILKMLDEGSLIFGFTETMEAGLVSVQPANVDRLVTPDALSYVAGRLFPASSFNRNQRGGD